MRFFKKKTSHPNFNFIILPVHFWPLDIDIIPGFQVLKITSSNQPPHPYVHKLTSKRGRNAQARTLGEFIHTLELYFFFFFPQQGTNSKDNYSEYELKSRKCYA